MKFIIINSVEILLITYYLIGSDGYQLLKTKE